MGTRRHLGSGRVPVSWGHAESGHGAEVPGPARSCHAGRALSEPFAAKPAARAEGMRAAACDGERNPSLALRASKQGGARRSRGMDSKSDLLHTQNKGVLPVDIALS